MIFSSICVGFRGVHAEGILPKQGLYSTVLRIYIYNNKHNLYQHLRDSIPVNIKANIAIK